MDNICPCLFLSLRLFLRDVFIWENRPLFSLKNSAYYFQEGVEPSEEDRILSRDGAKVIIDETSLDYLKGKKNLIFNKDFIFVFCNLEFNCIITNEIEFLPFLPFQYSKSLNYTFLTIRNIIFLVRRFYAGLSQRVDQSSIQNNKQSTSWTRVFLWGQLLN